MQLNPQAIKATMTELIEDYRLTPIQVTEIIRLGLKTAYKKDYMPNARKAVVQVQLGWDGSIRILREYQVVKKIEDDEIQMTLAKAIKHDTEAQVGQTLLVDITPDPLIFSRIWSQAAAQTIKQNIKSIERERFFDKFQDKQGELLRAKVLRVAGETVILDIEGVTVVLMAEGQIPGKIYNPGEEIYVLLRQISKDSGGINLDITQSSGDFIEAILWKLIPELSQGKVEILKIARIPGKKSKLIVHSSDERIDPVGVFIWPNGERINTILSLLDGERLDFIEYVEWDELKLIQDCFKPAKLSNITFKGRRVVVKVSEDQKPLAIGKGAVNIKLAQQLTGYMIEVR
jgi:N utilization substance protein A